MPKCPCGKNFHACSSCDLYYSWEYEYCCEEHWEKYDKKYQHWKSKFKALYTTINSVQQKFLIELLNMDSDYGSEIESWLKEINGD